MIKKLRNTIIGLLLITTAGTANASFIWTGTGPVGPVLTGSDVESLVGATLTLSIEVSPGSYGSVFSLAFAPIATGGITISGSSIAANNTTHAFTFPFAAQIPPYGFAPLFPVVLDNLFFLPAITLPSGNIMTLAHSMPPTPTGALATPGSAISITDFPSGSPLFPNFTAAVFPNAIDPPLTQYASSIPTFTATESAVEVPEPGALLLYLLGFSILGFARLVKK